LYNTFNFNNKRGKQQNKRRRKKDHSVKLKLGHPKAPLMMQNASQKFSFIIYIMQLGGTKFELMFV